MKILLLLRHAKSSWKDEKLADFDRPLSKRGKRDAPAMGQLLREENLAPDFILSSTALRARQTTDLVVEASGYDGEIRWMDDLYAAPPETILDSLREVPDTIQSVMVVAHNPGLSELVAWLTEEDEPMPTAALAQINLTIQQWQELGEASSGTLVYTWRPRELED
jgi:phosphohistidine phosphatase